MGTTTAISVLPIASCALLPSGLARGVEAPDTQPHRGLLLNAVKPWPHSRGLFLKLILGIGGRDFRHLGYMRALPKIETHDQSPLVSTNAVIGDKIGLRTERLARSLVSNYDLM